MSRSYIRGARPVSGRSCVSVDPAPKLTAAASRQVGIIAHVIWRRHLVRALSRPGRCCGSRLS